jgi:hypothetical protein
MCREFEFVTVPATYRNWVMSFVGLSPSNF